MDGPRGILSSLAAPLQPRLAAKPASCSLTPQGKVMGQHKAQRPRHAKTCACARGDKD